MADSLTSGHTACCPLCSAEMLPGQELNQDHVFVRALGGRDTVTTHKQCNSQSGSGPEGSLQGPNTVINFLKAAKGLDAPPVRGTFPSALGACSLAYVPGFAASTFAASTFAAALAGTRDHPPGCR